MSDARAYPISVSPAHPIHVILAAFPIACFTGAFLTDITYAQTYEMMWANFSIWLITAGLVMGVLAAIAGYLVHRRVRPRRSASPHTIGNVLALILSLVNAFVHSRDAYTSVMPAGLILSGIVAVLVLVSSWLGTSVAYRSSPEGTL
ncbi:MAG: Succinate dehydrogenase cytochrome b subunit family protein [Sphingomonas bacterium]|nr:Succinate dehydrogenase cytochrome b subunit family protein [Sphingomonas bacterium]